MSRPVLIYFILLILCFPFTGCDEKETPPFTTNSSFMYAASYTTPDGRVTQHDTLTFTILEKDITAHSVGVKKIRWENTRHDYYQVRGLNTEDGSVELQLPLNYRGFDNELIAVAGHPAVSLIATPGYTVNEEDIYSEAYGRLTGLAIKHRTKSLGDTSILFDGELIPCRQLQCENISHTDTLGKYRLLFTYNPGYGFITMNYHYPDGKLVSLRLVDVAISGK